MNLFQIIINYYHGEARHGLWAAVIGLLLLAGGIILLKFTAPLSLLKGLSVPMLFFGLLVGGGGAADNLYTRKATPEKIALYQKDAAAFLRQEKVKVERTHNGWHRVRVLWALLGLGGLALSLLIKKPFWIGAGLGMIALAVIISLFELYSMRFNERYYQTIQSAKIPQADNSVSQLQLKMQQPPGKPQIAGQTYVRPQNDTSRRQSIPQDSLAIASIKIITSITIDDTVVFASDSLKLPVPANNQVPDHRQKKKLLDYYNSDLIQANGVNAKHCWFSKKYVKE